jgi:hypothetical protein
MELPPTARARRDARALLFIFIYDPNAAAKKRARTARLSAPDSVAALRSEGRANSPESPSPVEVCFTGAPDQAGVETHFTAPSEEFLETCAGVPSVNELIQTAMRNSSETVKPISNDRETAVGTLKPVSIPLKPVSEIACSVQIRMQRMIVLLKPIAPGNGLSFSCQ